MATDRDLIGQCLTGDRSAFDEIVRRYQDGLFRHALRLSGSREQAEDLCQEAFIRFYRALSSFDHDRPIAPFLFKIATNLWLDTRRPQLVVVGEEAMEFLPAAQQSDQALLDRVERRAILAAVHGLRPEYREALSLRYDQGLSYREIGEITGAPPGTVATRLSRGLEALRQALGVTAKEAAQ
jgi:RNA polymerase sigma-70 factor (ECF subfamily)